MSADASFVTPITVQFRNGTQKGVSQGKGRGKGKKIGRHGAGVIMRYRPETGADDEYGKTPAEQVFNDGYNTEWQQQAPSQQRMHKTPIDSNIYRVDPDLIAVDSEENLRGFIKTRGSLVPGEEFVFWWVGDIYDMVDGQSSRHLFSFEGFNIGRMVRVDGGWRLLTREVGLYKDPKTGQILDVWKNPETGAIKECIHVWNDPVNQQFLLRGPRGNFRVPTTMHGDDIYWHSEIFLKYRSPLTRKEYPHQVQSDTYQSTEMFQFFSKREDMIADKPSADCLISWVRVGQWLPWMEMGNRPGRLVYHCRGRKLKNGFSDLSEDVRKYVEAHHPEYSSAPKNYTTPNETSWTYMKKLLDSKGYPRADGTVARPEPRGSKSAHSDDRNRKVELRHMTTDQLAAHDGSNPSKPIYLSIAGKIFDVSSAKRHYGRGETYNCLTGRDATYAFVSGDLTDRGLNEATPADLQNLTKDQRADIDKWVEFFVKTYPEVGILAGR